MAEGLQNITLTKNVVIVGWFKFPAEISVDYKVTGVLHDIVIVVSLLLNPVLLWMIVKNPGSKTRTNSSILIGSLCVVNIVLSGFGFVHFVDDLTRSDDDNIISYKMMSTVMSIFLPKYYASTFLLALLNYGMIVTPLKFQTLAPKKPRTMVLITFVVWMISTVAYVISSFFVEDFDNYMEIVVTVQVSISWLITFVIVAMYAKILSTLCRRKVALKTTLNVANSRQGWLVIKQNTRLAKALFFYVAILVLCTLPLYTGIMLVFYCPQCNQTAITNFCLCMIPISMSVMIFHPLHWLFCTPQYYKESKRLCGRVVVLYKLVRRQLDEMF